MYGESAFSAKKRYWKRMRRLGLLTGLLALTGALALGALFFFCFSYSQLDLWMRSAHWVETPAQVLESRLDVKHGTPGKGGGGVTYAVRIRYRYVWAGKTYVSERYSPLDGVYSGSHRLDRMKASIAARPKGGKMVCLVDPEAPDSALAVRELDTFCVSLGAFFFLCFAAAGIFGLWYLAKSPIHFGRKKRSAFPDVKRQPGSRRENGKI